MGGKLKTPNASDVLSAMEEMAFQRFVTPSKEALEACRREQKGKEGSFRAKEGQRQKTTQIRKSRTRAGRRTAIKMRKGWRKKHRRKRESVQLKRMGRRPWQVPRGTLVHGRVVLTEEPEKIEIKTELSSGLPSKPVLPRLRASE